MNWLAFAVSLVGMLCVMLLWQAVDSWMYRRATRLQRLVSSGLLFLAIAVPGVWLLPSQSDSIRIGAKVGLVISGAVGVLHHRRTKQDAM